MKDTKFWVEFQILWGGGRDLHPHFNWIYITRSRDTVPNLESLAWEDRIGRIIIVVETISLRPIITERYTLDLLGRSLLTPLTKHFYLHFNLFKIIMRQYLPNWYFIHKIDTINNIKPHSLRHKMYLRDSQI